MIQKHDEGVEDFVLGFYGVGEAEVGRSHLQRWTCYEEQRGYSEKELVYSALGAGMDVEEVVEGSRMRMG